MEKYEVLESLGESSLAEVFRGRVREDDSIKYQSMDDSVLVPSLVLREISVLKRLELIKLHANFDTEELLYLIFKFMYGALSAFIRGSSKAVMNPAEAPCFFIISPTSEESELFCPLTRETRTLTNINSMNNFEIAGQATPFFQEGHWFILFERAHGRVELFNGDTSVILPNLQHLPDVGFVKGGYHGNPLLEGDYQVLIINGRGPFRFMFVFDSSRPEDGWIFSVSGYTDNRPEYPMGSLSHSKGFSYIDRIHGFLVVFRNYWDREIFERDNIEIDEGALIGVQMICLFAREGEGDIFGMVTHTMGEYIHEDRYDIYKFSEVIPDHPNDRITFSPYQMLTTENLLASPWGPGTLTRFPIDHTIELRQSLFLSGFWIDCSRFNGGTVPMQQDREVVKTCSHPIRGVCQCRSYVIVSDVFGG